LFCPNLAHFELSPKRSHINKQLVYLLVHLLFLLTFFTSSPLVASAKEGATVQIAETSEAVTVPKFVTIPVYYATDREEQGQTFGTRRRYHELCEHELYYGTAFVTVPNLKKKVLNEKLKNLNWQAADHKGGNISKKDKIDATHPVMAKENFIHRVKMSLDKEALDEKGKPQLCLFVHGAADAFEFCVEDAAELAYYMERPMVIYSWPSDPHLRGYFIDSTNIEWSQKHFNMFCSDLLELKRERPVDVICLSHSMGNRLVIRALPVVYGKGLIADWEMISPDIDADTCRHYMMGFTQPNAKIRLYVSNKDIILPFTQMLNGGYYRLGEAANPAWDRLKRDKAEYLERIDFTLIDKGWYGHSLPFELVANMVDLDKPGEGYALVPETSVKANRVARFAGRSERLSATSGEADFCSKLVRSK